MKTYLSNLIPQLQQFSQKLDRTSLLKDKHWVVIEEPYSNKTVYIFRSSGALIISKDGRVTKGEWEYVGNDSLIIDIAEQSYLFKQGFFDDNVLALRIDNSNSFFLLVNELTYANQVSNPSQVESLLEKKYLSKEKKTAPLPQPTPISQVRIADNYKKPTSETKPETISHHPTAEQIRKRKQGEKIDNMLQICWFAFLGCVSFAVSYLCLLGIIRNKLWHRDDKFFFWLISAFGSFMFFMGVVFMTCVIPFKRTIKKKK